MRLKRVATLLAFTLIFSVFSFLIPSSTVNAATNKQIRDKAAEWVTSLKGRAINYDQVEGCQCVDPVYFYAASYLGHPELVSGNAIDFANKKLPAGWAFKENPAVGDIVVWGPGVNMGHYIDAKREDNAYADSVYGHVGIVVGVRSSTIVTIEQNTYHYGQICAPCERAIGTALIYIDPFGDGDSVPKGVFSDCYIKEGKLYVGGWAYDPDEPSKSIMVHIYSGSTLLKSVTANVERPDVNQAESISGKHGFNTLIDIAPGNHQIIVYAINSAGGSNNNRGLGSYNITLSGSGSGSGNTDNVPDGVFSDCYLKDGKAFVGGWAYDPDEPTQSIPVHVYVNGNFLQAIPTEVLREDVNAAKGITGKHGFNALLNLTPGSYSISVFAINSAGGTEKNKCLATKEITVPNTNSNTIPDGVFSDCEMREGKVFVGGWAYDPDEPAKSIPVHVYVNGYFLQAISTEAYRPDVNEAKGITGNHGFNALLDLAPGSYSISIWAIDSAKGANKFLSTKDITIPAYSVSLRSLSNGKAKLSKTSAREGEIITVSVEPNPCFELDAIIVDGTRISGNTFTMPAKNITVQVTFKAKSHHLTIVDGKAATCENDGFESYYKCSECNKLFSDAEGKNSIDEPLVINRLGHKLKEVAEKAPTKNEPGNIRYYICDRCEKFFSDSEGKHEIDQVSTVIPKMTHELTHVAAKSSTCTEDGNKEYYICKDTECGCGKKYSDKYGQHEIQDIVIPATGHHVVSVPAKDATCTEDGYEAHYKCDKCNKLFSDAEGKNEIENPVAISKLGHDMKHIEAKKPTHDDDGHIEYYHCDRCGKNFADSEGSNPLADAELVVPRIGAAVLGEEITEGDFIYKVTNPRTDGTGTVTIIGVANKTAAVVIPATVELKLDAYKVNRIGTKAFYGNKTITTLSIGGNVVIIESYAFYGCSNLVKVSGGKALKTIGTKAFAYCSKLKSFSISSTVLYKIGSYAFQKDKKLKTVYIKYTTKLTKSGVKKSLKSSSVKTVKVKKSKVKKYKKYFTKKNAGRSVKVKK